jgi:hypothetical protein
MKHWGGKRCNMKNKYDLTKAPVSLLAAVIKESGFLKESWSYVEERDCELNDQEKAVRDLREAARVPLRTRAEVDADILRIFRANAKPCCMQVHKGVDKKIVKMCDNTHSCLHALLTEDCLDSGF